MGSFHQPFTFQLRGWGSFGICRIWECNLCIGLLLAMQICTRTSRKQIANEKVGRKSTQVAETLRGVLSAGDLASDLAHLAKRIDKRSGSAFWCWSSFGNC